MALKADLESREADCASVEDFVELAREALAEPVDADYARHLLEQAADQSQFPADHCRVAEAALAAGLAEMAEAAYQQAEEFCMEAQEFVTVGASLAAHTDQRDKARELFERAAGEMKRPEELIDLAAQARAAFGDDDLAGRLLGKVREQLSTLDDFKAQAKALLDAGDADSARLLYGQAAGLGDEIADTVRFAGGLVELFDDASTAGDLLAGREGDCMFPGQFVALAKGFRQILNDGDKAAALLEQGKEFAMSGEENLDLANGYAALLGDQSTALGLYRNALADLSSKDDLIRLAGDMAAHLDDKSEAAKAYEKAESKITDANDLAGLAKAVHDALGDKSLAAGIFSRATGKLDQPNELLRLGGEILATLDDKATAADVYRRALDRMTEYGQVQRLLDVLAGGFDDADLARAALNKALETADSTVALIDVARRNRTLDVDPALTARALDMAEEAVDSLDGIRKLNDAVGELAADDTGRAERISAKLAKREASQAKYVAFQDREKRLTRAKEFIDLADEVRDELDDPFYAGQLLERAQEVLDEGHFNLPLTCDLINAVDRLVGDADRVRRLLDAAAAKIGYFVQLRSLGQTATGLSDGEFGRQWTRGLYEQWAQRIADDSGIGAQEVGKFAHAVHGDLGDAEWAHKLLEQARGRAAGPLDLVWLGRYARQWGDDALAEACYQQAAEACTDAGGFAGLVRQLRQFGEPETLCRTLYGHGDQKLSEPLARLRWAEGIVREFGDSAWAAKVYEGLSGAFDDASVRPVFDYSRETYLNRRRG